MNECTEFISRASCLINVRLYNIGFSSKFSHVPENMDPSVIDALTKYLQNLDPIHDDNNNGENICKIVIGTERYLIVGIYGYLMDFVPDFEEKFDQFKDVAGRPSHGIVALVWDKQEGRLPDRFPTLDSFAQVLQSKILSPLPEEMILTPPGSYISEKQMEIIQKEWNSKTPEEQWRQLVPWFLQDGIDWSTPLHNGVGHKAKYDFQVSLQGDAPSKDIINALNSNMQGYIKAFSRINESQLLNAAVYVAGNTRNSFSFRTNADYQNREKSYYMNITCEDDRIPNEGVIDKNSYSSFRGNTGVSSYGNNYNQDGNGTNRGYRSTPVTAQGCKAYSSYLIEFSVDAPADILTEVCNILEREAGAVLASMNREDNGNRRLRDFNSGTNFFKKSFGAHISLKSIDATIKKLFGAHISLKSINVNIFLTVDLPNASKKDIFRFVERTVAGCSTILIDKYGKDYFVKLFEESVRDRGIEKSRSKKTQEPDGNVLFKPTSVPSSVPSSNTSVDLSSLVKKKKSTGDNDAGSTNIPSKKKPKKDLFE